MYEHNIAANYVRFAREIDSNDDFKIAVDYAMELSRATRPYREPRVVADQFLSMQQRHAQAVMEVLAQQIKRHSKLIASGGLNKSSLLAMVVRDDMEIEPATAVVGGNAHPPESNVFVKTGHSWTISYAGRQVIVDDSIGLVYLHELLSNPGQYIAAETLVANVKRRTLNGSSAPDTVQVKEALESDIRYEEGDSYDKVLGDDNGYGAELREQLKAALTDLAISRRSGADKQRIDEAQSEVDKIRNLIAKSMARTGKSRTFATVESKARSAVGMAVLRAIKKLIDVHPSLAAHLRASVVTGQRCLYRPQEKTQWDF